MTSRKMKSELELAWAAGFFDGEGHISARRTKRRSTENGEPRYGRVLQFRVTQKYPEVLERFQAAVGYGKIYMTTRPTGDIYSFAIYGRQQVIEVANMLLPLVSPRKKEQIELALEKFEYLGTLKAGDFDKEEK